MQKIIVIGNSIANVKAIEKILSKNKNFMITLFLEGEGFPWMLKRKNNSIALLEDETLYRPKFFYNHPQIQLLPEDKILKINFKKHQIITESKEIHPYDFLIISQLSNETFFDIKGGRKQGIFNSLQGKHVRKLLERIEVIETIFVELKDIESLQIALALKGMGKEIFGMIRSNGSLSSILGDEINAYLIHLLEKNGIRILKNEAIQEILGDQEIKAVKVTSHKVFSAQAVVLGSCQFKNHIGKELISEDKKEICVDKNCCSIIPQVFCVENFAKQKNGLRKQFLSEKDRLENQGCSVANEILKKEEPYEKRRMFHDIKIGNDVLSFCGDLSLYQDTKEIINLFEKEKRIEKLFIRNNGLQGVILINCDEKKEEYLSMLQRQNDISFKMDQFINEEDFNNLAVDESYS
jgi:nitrite reductase (NADH) large subunit